jgi:outer membrane protein assembly factor BamC
VSRNLFVLLLVLGLSACSWTSDKKAVYEKKAEHEQVLEVPPDLALPEDSNALDVPAIGTRDNTFSSYSGSRQQANGKVLAAISADAKVVRDGNVQWLEIKASADQLWPQLIAFFRSQGFEIKISDTRLGIIETDWLENRVDVPTGWLSRLLRKLYDSGLRDKYRVRMEKADEATTRIFIAHRGLEEQATEGAAGEVIQTYWQVRQSDPDLEAEMMQRFLVFRGMDKDEAQSLLKPSEVQERAVLKEDGDVTYLAINENFPRSWRRTGLALDRIGLLVEDRNRSAGMYYIKLTEEYWTTHQDKDKSWLSNLFSSEEQNKESEYILKLAGEGDSTRITILDRAGNKATDKTSRALLGQLQRYLR